MLRDTGAARPPKSALRRPMDLSARLGRESDQVCRRRLKPLDRRTHHDSLPALRPFGRLLQQLQAGRRHGDPVGQGKRADEEIHPQDAGARLHSRARLHPRNPGKIGDEVEWSRVADSPDVRYCTVHASEIFLVQIVAPANSLNILQPIDLSPALAVFLAEKYFFLLQVLQK
jgi:hypothetical protein